MHWIRSVKRTLFLPGSEKPTAPQNPSLPQPSNPTWWGKFWENPRQRQTPESGVKRSIRLHPSKNCPIWEDQVSTIASPSPGQASSTVCIAKAAVPGFMKTQNGLYCLTAFQTYSAYYSQSISTSSSQRIFECWSCQTRTDFDQCHLTRYDQVHPV